MSNWRQWEWQPALLHNLRKVCQGSRCCHPSQSPEPPGSMLALVSLPAANGKCGFSTNMAVCFRTQKLLDLQVMQFTRGKYRPVVPPCYPAAQELRIPVLWST